MPSLQAPRVPRVDRRDARRGREGGGHLGLGPIGGKATPTASPSSRSTYASRSRAAQPMSAPRRWVDCRASRASPTPSSSTTTPLSSPSRCATTVSRRTASCGSAVSDYSVPPGLSRVGVPLSLTEVGGPSRVDPRARRAVLGLTTRMTTMTSRAPDDGSSSRCTSVAPSTTWAVR